MERRIETARAGNAGSKDAFELQSHYSAQGVDLKQVIEVLRRDHARQAAFIARLERAL